MAVPGIYRVRSRSIRGAAEISAQFNPSTDMIVALQTVQNRVSEITGELPAGTQLQVERMTPEIFPVFILSLTGALPTPELYDYANFVARPEIARVQGAGMIDVQASDTAEIEVILDPTRLAAAQLTVVDVCRCAQGAEHAAAGRAIPGRRTPASDARDRTVEEHRTDRGRPVRMKDGATIRVRDVGTVTRGRPDRTVLITGGGRDAVSISIAQQIGANILDLKAGVDDALARLGKALPSGLKITRVYDLAEFVEESIASVRDAILIGGFLAIVVLLVFLRDWRLTLIAAVTLAAGGHSDLPLPLAVRRHDQPDVDGRPRRRHRPGHRRCRRSSSSTFIAWPPRDGARASMRCSRCSRRSSARR
jgi:multidrug efflux pump subunit AcrB